MSNRENTWTERKPYPAAPREKYGITLPSRGAHEEHIDKVEATHVAAVSGREIRARQRGAEPSHALGYGGIGELDAREFQEAEWAFGLDPGSPPCGPDEVAPQHEEPADEDEEERLSHGPEGGSGRATFPSLDRVSLA